MHLKKNRVKEEILMNRQKRDRSERAFSKGYKAGQSGQTKSACPYNTNEERSQWLGGWREANEERNAGYVIK